MPSSHRTLRRAVLPAVLPAVCLAAALAVACASGDVARDDGRDVYHVTQERHGQTAVIAVGQPLAVVLPSIAGSASRWTPQEYDTSVLQQASGTRTIGGRHGGMIIGGSQGYEQILFRALRAGRTTLRLTRVRTAAEGGGTVAFEIHVVVAEGG